MTVFIIVLKILVHLTVYDIVVDSIFIYVTNKTRSDKMHGNKSKNGDIGG